MRLTPQTAEILRQFVRDHAGKPLYLELGEFVEGAVLHEIDRVTASLAAGGNIPLHRVRMLPPSDNHQHLEH